MCWSTSDRGAQTNKVPHISHAGARIKAMRAVNETAPNPNRCMTLSECGKGEYGGIGLNMPPSKIAKQVMKINSRKVHP